MKMEKVTQPTDLQKARATLANAHRMTSLRKAQVIEQVIDALEAELTPALKKAVGASSLRNQLESLQVAIERIQELDRLRASGRR